MSFQDLFSPEFDGQPLLELGQKCLLTPVGVFRRDHVPPVFGPVAAVRVAGEELVDQLGPLVGVAVADEIAKFRRGVGIRPVRSRVTRRMKPSSLTIGAGLMWSCRSSAARSLSSSAEESA